MSLSAEDVALGYKQLMVERAFRTLKSTLSLRPVYHTRSDRIRSHVMFCWLGLLLVGGDPAERAGEGALVTGFEDRNMMGDDSGGEVVMWRPL